jgi:type IV secretory pathway TrbD component
MLMGDEKVIILPNQSPGPELVLGLQWYFWGFAVVLLFVSIAMMMVDREDEKEETLTVLSPSEPPKR